MAYITEELDLEETENWFKIGQNVSTNKTPKIVASSALGGRSFDPQTGEAFEYDQQKAFEAKLPTYRRNKYAEARQQYLEEYMQKQQNELLSYEQDTVESISRNLESLELDSSVAVPEELIPEGATDVYKNYKFQHNYAQLPVLEKYDEIIRNIESSQVTVIQGPTGSGKTTQVPQFILDHCASISRYCNIVVTQPRKIAASSIALRVCEERGWEVGTICGYQHGLIRKVSEDTRLTFCTTGVLKEKLIQRKNMHEFTHVILDEVHERDIETDFALLIVKKLLRTNSPHVKVILMSATFDTQMFAQYFCLPVRGCLEQATVVTVGTAYYHVSEFFADDLTSKLGEIPPVSENEPGVCSAMYDMAVGLIKEFDFLEEKEHGKDAQTGFATLRGTVLIFLPGLLEIMNMCERVQALEETYFLLPIPLHSTITLEEQHKVFKKPQRGFRKVIISTNIAESSITVTDIKYVIDFCLTKSLCCDPETNYQQLRMMWASKANANQRKGRAGRVSNGRVYYMVPHWFYDEVLPEYGTPEMQRCPLDNLILKTKVLDMGEPKAILSLALSPPDLDNIGRTILDLKEIGALSSDVGNDANPYDGTLTFIGRVLAALPVDIHVGKMLVLAHVFGVLEECLIIGAAMSVKSIFASPMQARLEAYKAKLSWSDNSLSDSIAMLNAYKVWENRVKMKEFERAGATEKQWGMKHFLQMKRMKEVQQVVMELEERLKTFNILRPRHSPHFKDSHTSAAERLILKLVLCGAFYPNFAVKEETDEAEAVKILSNNDPLRTVMVKGLPMDQGILYEKQLKDIFSSCWKDPAPYISCEQSRAFIEFANKKGAVTEGKVHQGVLIAIKIRQLGIKLPLDLLDKDETDRRLAQLQKITSSRRGEGNLRTGRLRAENKEDMQLVGSFIDLDPQISTLFVYVTAVIECGHFWGQCHDVRTTNHLQQIQSILNNPRDPLKILLTKIEAGALVAAPYCAAEVHYYRARIEEIQLQNNTTANKPVTYVKVFFVDYGNTEFVPVEQLRTLPPACLKHPFLALEFYLMGIKPSHLRCTDGMWTEEANKLFCKWALNESLFAQVYSVVNNAVRVELVARFFDGKEICFNEELIQNGLAEKAEEAILSQQNHDWRETEKTRAHSATRPDSWMQVSMSSESKDHGGAKRKTKKIYLMGPTNPLEVSYSSMTCSGRQRTVRVDPESVNCVAIDDDPQNKYSRLMIACFLGLNPAGNSLLARETTIMPQLPGLPALITLVFAPYTEYRTDPKRQRYTGAICGLGYDEDNCSIFPDHDIELAFETKFDTEDIAMINEVRMAINFALGTDDTAASWGEDMIVRCQERARNTLLALLGKPRESVEPKIYSKMHTWKQIEPKYTCRHNLGSTETDYTHLLRLHDAICLANNASASSPRENKTARYLIRHLEQLKKTADSHHREPVQCELCSVVLPNSHLLAIHLHTETHLRKVAQIRKEVSKSDP